MHFFITGLILGLSLIIALGPQNLFLIEQGVKGEYAWLTASICFACDTFLIVASIFGLSHLVLKFPLLKNVLLIGGVGFLLIYGVQSIKHSYQTRTSKAQGQTIGARTKVIVFTLSFSLLNPQAIIDTLIMIGGSANQLNHHDQYPFMFGVIASSFMWFYALTLTATRFSQILARQAVYQWLEFGSGLLMICCAIKLLLH